MNIEEEIEKKFTATINVDKTEEILVASYRLPVKIVPDETTTWKVILSDV